MTIGSSVATLSPTTMQGVTLAPGSDLGSRSVIAANNNYNYTLGGNVVWYPNPSGGKNIGSQVIIDANGHAISQTGNGRWFNISSGDNANFFLLNAIVSGNDAYHTGSRGLLNASSANSTLNVFLEGTTFRNFTGGSADYNTSTIFTVYHDTAILNINGGSAGVIFEGNTGVGKISTGESYDSGAGVLGVVRGTATVSGKVTFLSNSGVRYGGAIAVNNARRTTTDYTSNAWINRSVLRFDSTSASDFALFDGNHAAVFGGAIDIWGHASETIVNTTSFFQNNYIYDASRSGIDDRAKRAGAINVGNEAGLSDLFFNAPATFINNRVIGHDSNATRGDAFGGAITAYSTKRDKSYNYRMSFNAGATFIGNYAHAPATGRIAQGGAIFHDATHASLDIGPNSRFEGNYAKNEGGAIYMSSGIINLVADSSVTGTENGNIVFKDNFQNVNFAQNGNAWTWRPTNIGTTAQRGAIYLAGDGILNIYARGVGEVHFYDPIILGQNSTAVINKLGTGDLIFHDHDNAITALTNVTQGRMVLENSKSVNSMMTFGQVTAGALNVGPITGNSFAAVVGKDGTTFAVGSARVRNGGRILVEDGGMLTFKVGDGGLVLENNGGIGGDGIINLVNRNNRRIQITTGYTGNNFYVTAPLATDKFRLESTSAVSTNTGISGAGTLRKDGQGAFYANGFDFVNNVTGGNKNTYTGGTVVENGSFVITARGQGDTFVNDSRFSMGTGFVEVQADGRLVIDFSQAILGQGVIGNYTITNRLTNSAPGGEVYLNLVSAGNPTGNVWSQSGFTAPNTRDFRGTFNLNNLNYTFATGTAALTNGRLIAGSGSTVTVPRGNHLIKGLGMNGGLLYFADPTAQLPVGNLPRMQSFIDISGTGNEGILDFGQSGTNSYVRINADAAMLTDIIEGTTFSNGQPVYTPLLLQDDYGNVRQLVASRTTTGDIKNVILQTQDSNDPYRGNSYVYTPTGKVEHNQGAQYGNRSENWADAENVTALKTLQSGASSLSTGPTNDGLYVGVQMERLELLAGKQTIFDNSNSNTAQNNRGNEFTAEITGPGHLGILGNAGNPIILSNSQNSYTGATIVHSGTLQGGTVDMLKNSIMLLVKLGAGFATGNFAQVVSSPQVDGIVQVDAPLTVYAGTADYVAGVAPSADAVANFNLASNIKGSGELIFQDRLSSGNGKVYIRGKNEFQGDITLDIQAGLFSLEGSLGSGQYNGNIRIASGSNDVDFRIFTQGLQEFTGDISGPAGSPTSGLNTITIGTTSHVSQVIFSGNNDSFAGEIVVRDSGILSIAGDQNLNAATAGRLLSNGGALALTGPDGTSYTKAWLLAGGAITTNNLSKLEMLYGSGTDSRLSGALEKRGSGELYFTGDNTLGENPGDNSIYLREGDITISGNLNSGTTGYKGDIYIANQSTLTFSPDTSATSSRQVLGGGGEIASITTGGQVKKTGDGILVVNNTIKVPFTLESGTLEGGGTIVSPTFYPGTVISPGLTAMHNHPAGVHVAGAIGTLIVGAVGDTTHFEGITYKMDVNHNNKIGTNPDVWESDRINVLGGATFGSGGASNAATRNTIDLSDMVATGVHTPGTPWVVNRTYVIMAADSGFFNTSQEDLNASEFRYKGILLKDYASRMAAVLTVENSTQLVMKTVSAPSSDLTWNNYNDTPSVNWLKGDATSVNDWYDTKLGVMHPERFYDYDTVRFIEASGIAKNVDVYSGGLIVSDIFITGSDYVFNGGKIAGAVHQFLDGSLTTGRLDVAANASATFNNAVDMEDIQISGSVRLNNTVSSKGASTQPGVSFDMTIAATGSATLGPNGSFTSGTRDVMAICNNGHLAFEGAPRGSYTYPGVISGSGSLSKTGSGSDLILTGVNTYTGATDVTDGGNSLYINGSSMSNTITIAGFRVFQDPALATPDNPTGWGYRSGSLLGGTGIHRGNIVVNSGGSFAPGHNGGTPGASIGQLTVNQGSVTLQSGAIFVMNISQNTATGATENTSLQLVNNSSLKGTGGLRLQLNFYNYGVQIGDMYTLVEFDTTSTADLGIWDSYGNFSSVGDDVTLRYGYAFTYKVFRNNSRIWLQVTGIVPEPSTYALIGGAALALLLAVRRRKKKSV